MLNPEYVKKVMENPKFENYYDLSIYIGLASYRPYTEYHFNQEIRLDRDYIPPYFSEEIYRNNKFLKVEGRYIHFNGEQLRNQ